MAGSANLEDKSAVSLNHRMLAEIIAPFNKFPKGFLENLRGDQTEIGVAWSSYTHNNCYYIRDQDYLTEDGMRYLKARLRIKEKRAKQEVSKRGPQSTATPSKSPRQLEATAEDLKTDSWIMPLWRLTHNPRPSEEVATQVAQVLNDIFPTRHRLKPEHVWISIQRNRRTTAIEDEKRLWYDHSEIQKWTKNGPKKSTEI